MKLKENRFIEEDESKNCVNYAWKDFKNYADCDNEYVRSALPKDLSPIWAAYSFDNVTERWLFKAKPGYTLPDYYSDLLDGTQPSDCPLPCSTISVDSRLLGHSNGVNSSMIDLTFNPTVLVTSTDFIQCTFATFLADMGGSMGLWLGLGLLQAVEILAQYLSAGWRRFRCWFICLFLMNVKSDAINEASHIQRV